MNTTNQVERAIIAKLCARLLLAGHRIAAVYDGEDYIMAGTIGHDTETYEQGDEPEHIAAPLKLEHALDAIYAVDSICTLHFTHKDSDTWGNRGVMLVTGNGSDVISDYHDYPDIAVVIEKLQTDIDIPDFLLASSAEDADVIAELLAVMRDVAALLPCAGRLHPKDLLALQTRVCTAIAKAEARS